MANYHTWPLESDIPLFVVVRDPTTGEGLAGQAPEVAFRRLSDGFYWDGATPIPGFAAPVNFEALAEVDAVNLKGLYELTFPNAILNAEGEYEAYYRITAGAAAGQMDVERHLVIDQSAWNGSGLRQITIDVDVVTVGTPIAGAIVDVFDATNTGFLFRTYTDALGLVTVGLDDGTYKLRLYAQGYTFTTPETLVVTADATAVIEGTGVAISPPSAPDRCVIYGTLRDASGRVHSGVCVDVYAVTPQTVSGVQKTKRIVSTRTNSEGYFEVELQRDAEVWIECEEAAIDMKRTVPDAASQDITTWT